MPAVLIPITTSADFAEVRFVCFFHLTSLKR